MLDSDIPTERNARELFVEIPLELKPWLVPIGPPPSPEEDRDWAWRYRSKRALQDQAWRLRQIAQCLDNLAETFR